MGEVNDGSTGRHRYCVGNGNTIADAAQVVAKVVWFVVITTL